MNKIEEQALALKEVAKSLLNEKTPKSEADKIASINDGLDAIIKENGVTLKEYDGLKNDYIGLIKKSGSTKEPHNPNQEPRDPVNSDEDFVNALSDFNKTIKK